MDRQELSGRDWLVVFGSDAIQVDLKTISITHDRFQETKLSLQRKWFRYFLLRGGEPLAAL